MIKYLIIGIIAIIIIIIANATKSNNKSNDNKTKDNINFNNYIKIDSILTEAEYNFFNVLKLALQNEEYIICPKIRVADFVKVIGKEDWQKRFNKISSKHVDFLICNNKLNPILAIELDDKSHNNQKERDNFINELYESINLPILRIKNGQGYSVIELREKIKESLLK